MTSNTNTHSRLRKSALRARRSLSKDERVVASTIICDLVIHSHEFMASKTLACYLPMEDEVDPSRIIERAWCAKKRIFVPVIDEQRKMIFRRLTPNTLLEQNEYGLWEPIAEPAVDAKTLDLVITPLVAFDESLSRIGMGGGYYDRCFQFLKHKKNWRRPKLLGIAFDCQQVDEIAPNPWDVPLYRVVTEKNY